MCTDFNPKFPDINLAIEGSASVNEICERYRIMLKSSDNLLLNGYANKLLEYLNIDNCLSLFEDEFLQFKKHLRAWSVKNHVKLLIKTRKKAFIGLNEKIRLFYPNSDKVHDLVGFRLVLQTYPFDTIDTVLLCYKLLNEVIRFFYVEKEYNFLDAEPLIGAGTPKVPGIIIPSEKNRLILKGFDNKVKDYIRYPKKDTAYQSLHTCVETLSGLVFEIQIRTFAMDVRADHFAYKQQRYADSKIDLDYSKIVLPGIAFGKNNKLICDHTGLLNSVDLFNNI